MSSERATAPSIGRPRIKIGKPLLEGDTASWPSISEESFIHSTSKYVPYPIIANPASVRMKFKSFNRHSKKRQHAMISRSFENKKSQNASKFCVNSVIFLWSFTLIARRWEIRLRKRKRKRKRGPRGGGKERKKRLFFFFPSFPVLTEWPKYRSVVTQFLIWKLHYGPCDILYLHLMFSLRFTFIPVGSP